MKTSRVAHETTKAVTSIFKSDFVPRRQTRSFAASLQTFTANGLPVQEVEQSTIKHEVDSDDSSSLSSLDAHDIEDLPLGIARSRKRKREQKPPVTAVTTISSSTSTRTSLLKAGVKIEDGAGGKVKRGRKQPAKKKVNEDGKVKIEPPANWEEMYDAVKEMRKERLAPVDTMGCETLAQEHLSPKDKRFQTLIALMLSSQTKDTTNALAMRRLQTELPAPGLTLHNILAIEPPTLNDLIYAVGFHNNKTRYIKATALILRDQFHGDIPDTIEGLMSLPGVGPKMAYLCLSAAWGRTEGIGVDVHVHRITNLWGWHETKGPEETRAALENWLPKERWHEINHLLVGFGQTICLPVGRKCGQCMLGERGVCPGAVAQSKTTVKREKRVKRVKREVVGNGVEVEKEEDAEVKEEGVEVNGEERPAGVPSGNTN